MIIIRTDFLNNNEEQCVKIINACEEFGDYVMNIAKEYDPDVIILENTHITLDDKPCTFLTIDSNCNTALLNKKICKKYPGYIYGFYIENIVEKICEWRIINMNLES